MFFGLPLHGQMELDNIIWQAVGSISNEDDQEIEVSWDVVNAGSTPIVLQASREILSSVTPYNDPFDFAGEGARDRFCWGELCFNYGTSVTPSNEALLVTIQPGQSNSTFKGLYEHMGVAGVSHFRYCFFETDNPESQICHEALFCVDAAECAVTVSEIHEPMVSNIAPNPVQSRSSFNYDFGGLTGDRALFIYNMVGSVVQQIPLNSPIGTVFLNADDFESGIYFYALMSNGAPVATKKFVVTK